MHRRVSTRDDNQHFLRILWDVGFLFCLSAIGEVSEHSATFYLFLFPIRGARLHVCVQKGEH
jgi:hypothetical protein